MNILHNFLHGEDTISFSSLHHTSPLPTPPPQVLIFTILIVLTTFTILFGYSTIIR